MICCWSCLTSLCVWKSTTHRQRRCTHVCTAKGGYSARENSKGCFRDTMWAQLLSSTDECTCIRTCTCTCKLWNFLNCARALSRKKFQVSELVRRGSPLLRNSLSMLPVDLNERFAALNAFLFQRMCRSMPITIGLDNCTAVGRGQSILVFRIRYRYRESPPHAYVIAT